MNKKNEVNRRTFKFKENPIWIFLLIGLCIASIVIMLLIVQASSKKAEILNAEVSETEQASSNDAYRDNGNGLAFIYGHREKQLEINFLKWKHDHSINFSMMRSSSHWTTPNRRHALIIIY
jgi:hypothetical protein